MAKKKDYKQQQSKKLEALATKMLEKDKKFIKLKSKGTVMNNEFLNKF